MRKKILSGSPLKTVCVAGFILALIVSWCMVLFSLIWGAEYSAGGRTRENTFTRSLKDYDLFNAPKKVLEGEKSDQIERRLSALQKQVRSAEDQLSVLKRRRALALLDRRYTDSYAKAARNAAETFAYSSPLAAVAAEAVLLFPFSGETPALLSNYASRISQDRFDLLNLGVHILAGNLENPAQAARIPELSRLVSLNFADFDLSGLPGQIQKDLLKDLLIDEFLLLAYRRDISGASLKLNALLSEAPETFKMGAEFYYDNNLPLKAAELFFRLEDNVRAADALVLAGEIPGARNVWLALSSPMSPPPAFEDNSSRQTRLRSYYNLASSSADQAEETSWLEKLFTQRGQDDSLGIYSVIRYTRLLDNNRGIAVLDEDGIKGKPLLDLELLRRKLGTLPPKRAVAEVWLLLGRHPEEEALYEWAAWYFDFQKLYAETAQLFKEADRKKMDGSWLKLHRSLARIREGKIDEGEKILKEAAQTSADWRISANLGRIQENRRAVSAALGYYETAAVLVREKSSAAQLQLRLSRCLEALGRTDESRKALEYALELDRENINIRRELRRFSGGF